MNIYIPTHMDSGNRGCEGIYRGTEKILEKNKIAAYSSNIELDKKMGLSVDNIKEKNKFSKIQRYYFKFRRLFSNSNRKKKYVSIEENAQQFLHDFIDEKESIILSTGGDEFCYDDNWVVYLNEYLNVKNALTVLWGCSVGTENLSEAKVSALKKFDIIIARESLTEAMLKNKLQLTNVYCYPDPAFIVEPEYVQMESMDEEKAYIGINLSNFVSGDVGETSLFRQNVYKLLDYILNETNMNVILIPHVFWKGQDDRIICNEIERKYNSSRINVLNTYEYNYCQIRYIIGKCKFFIGARTHAVISAYSMCVPTIALGYSVKSIGIANDLGLPSELVVDYRKLSDENEILNALIYMIENETEIRKHLEKVIPNYSKKSYEAKKILINKIEMRK